MVSPPWSAPAPPQASSSLLSPGRGSPAVRPKQDKQALPCAGRVSADTVAGSYHPETGGGGAEPLPRASVSWTAVGWKGACWAEIGSSLRPEQRNYPPHPKSLAGTRNTNPSPLCAQETGAAISPLDWPPFYLSCLCGQNHTGAVCRTARTLSEK